MAFSAAVDCHIRELRSGSLFNQERRRPDPAKQPVVQLKAGQARPTIRIRTAIPSERSEIGQLTLKQETRSPFLHKCHGRRLCFRVVAQAGRPKPRHSQPIRPRRRRTAEPPKRNQPDPAGNIPRKLPSGRSEHEPYVRHPDDYYKFGPFGPYSYKADVDGPMIPATSFADYYYFMWSSIKDLHHQEEVDIENAIINYHNRVRLFDERAGLQFFYVFARLHFYVGHEPPWKQWTLVAEITVESGEDLDKKNLMEKLDNSIRNKITKFTSWIRPDLIYVRPQLRGFQVRFEPQMDYLKELRGMLMKSVGEPDEADSYYGLFCQILGVDLNSDSEDIIAKYEGSSEDVQLACLEHLLSNHPVELLHYEPYPNRNLWTREQTRENNERNNGETLWQKNAVNTEGFDVSHDVEYSDGKEDDDEDEYQEENEDEDWDNLDDNEIRSRVTKGLLDPKYDEPEVDNSKDFSSDAIDSDTEEYGGKGAVRLSFMVKAAARPFTYVNLMREMIVLRGSLLRRKQQEGKLSLLNIDDT